METLKIGQVARLAGVDVGTIRFYEREGLLRKPDRDTSGYRRYTRDAVARLRFITRAKGLLFTLDEIKHLLAIHDNPAGRRAGVRAWTDRKAGDLDRQAQSLNAAREALARLPASCTGDGPASECPILLAIGGHANGAGHRTEWRGRLRLGGQLNEVLPSGREPGSRERVRVRVRHEHRATAAVVMRLECGTGGLYELGKKRWT